MAEPCCLPDRRSALAQADPPIPFSATAEAPRRNQKARLAKISNSWWKRIVTFESLRGCIDRK